MKPVFEIQRNPEDPAFALFARAEDHMVIGAVRGAEAMFGEDPKNATTRTFLDTDSAMAWLKLQCCELIGRYDVDFVEVPTGRMIQVPKNRIVV